MYVHAIAGTIVVGQTLSNIITLGGESLLRVYIPTNFTATSISFQLSYFNNPPTFADLYDELGNLYAIPVVAGRIYYIQPGPLVGVLYLRIKAGVAQAGTDAVISLITQELI